MKQVELIEKRKPREKHFLQEDGTIVACIYDSDIHYLKNGQYEEINNDLIQENNYFVNKSNSYKVFFKENNENELLKLEINNHFLNMKLAKESIALARKTPKIIKNQLTYTNILDDIDIDYKILPSRIKESIILKNKENIMHDITFEIETDLELVLNEDKSISADDNNKTHFIIDIPYMIDSNNNINNNVYYTLMKNDNIYKLTLVLDKKWLEKKETIFPVIVDPTITTKTSDSGIIDTYIYPGDTAANCGVEDILKVGVTKINNNDTINRALLKFDLPNIGTASQVIDARLCLVGYPAPYGTYDSDIVEIHRVTSSWNESNAKWNTMYDKFDSRVEACFHSQRSITYIDNSILPKYNYANITNLVKSWYAGDTNNGIMLKNNSEVYNTNYNPAFFSKDNTVSGYNPKPYIQITYRNQNGLEKYMKYVIDTFSNGNSYVNVYNGNLTTAFDILSSISNVFPASLKLFYNTNSFVLNEDIGYGRGYRLNYSEIIKVSDLNNYLEYVDEDGTIHYFYMSKTTHDENGNITTITDNNTYYDEDGLDLTIYDSNDRYILKDKYNNRKIFLKDNNSSRLIRIINNLNKEINIEYTPGPGGTISCIYDCDNNMINVSYYGSSIVFSSANTAVELNYNSSNLISIVNKLGTTTFEYNNLNLISSITDTNGKKVKFFYYDTEPYRIMKISNHGLNNDEYYNVQFDYNNAATTLTDSYGKVKTYTFNNYGNIASMTNLKSSTFTTDAYGIVGEYGEYYQEKNKVVNSGFPIKHVKNILTNTSFEGNDIIFSNESGITSEISTDFSNSGSKSLKITSTVASRSITKTISVPKGHSYTFSAYVKNNNNIKLILSYLNSSEQVISSESEITEVNNNFERYDVTIDYPSDSISNLTIKILLPSVSVCYIDDIQLEVGNVVNSYNYIENSDFSSGYDGWTTTAYESGNDQIINVPNRFEIITLDDNSKALKIMMDPKYSTSLSKSFNLSGEEGDSYTISFWYKNEGVISDNENIYNSAIINFEYTYGQCSFPSTPLNVNCNEWQFFSYTFVAEHDYSAIYMSIFQDFNANNLYITNVSLFKNMRKKYYQYDMDGNIISLTGFDLKNVDFKYDSSNLLNQKKLPNGTSVKYEYDSEMNKANIKNSITETGLSCGLKYNDNGKIIESNIYNNKFNGETGLYSIRVAGTNDYLRLLFDSARTDDGYKEKWLVTRIENNDDIFYTISHPIINDKYITPRNTLIELTEYMTNDQSLFRFIMQPNGSYLLQSIIYGTYIKAYGGSLFMSQLEDNRDGFEFYIENCSKEFIESNTNYDYNDSLLSTTDTLLNDTKYTIDDSDKLITKIENKNFLTNYSYDTKSRLSEISSFDRNVQYTYDTNNLLTKIKQGSKEFNFTYDNNLKNTVISIGNIPLITKNYNNNLVSSIQYGNLNSISYQYDEHGRNKKTIKMDDTFEYFYDNKGAIAKVKSNNCEERYAYDYSMRLNKYKFNDMLVRYNYDLNDNIINQVYKLDDNEINVDYVYNEDDVITMTKFNNQDMFNYTYDELGRIVNKKINNSFNINYEYMKNGNRVSSIIKNIFNGNDKITYKYCGSNIKDIYLNDLISKKYYYSKYNELIREDDFLNGITIRYKYDNYGNILSKKEYKLNTFEFITGHTYKYSNVNWPDLLTKYDADVITYDNIGNPVQIGNTQLSWANGRKLKTIIDNNLNAQYFYDKNGFRIKKVLNNITTFYYLENNRIKFEKTNGNVIYYLYDDADGLLGIKYNNDKYYYIKNMMNDITGILDSNFNLVAKYEYDSFGNIVSIQDSTGNDLSSNPTHIANINPYRYRSYYFDKETNLYYLNDRYYNPRWGRFLNADSYLFDSRNISSCNLFMYCANDFINSTDSTGAISISFKDIKKKVNNVAKSVKQAVKNTCNAVKTAVKNTYNTVKEAVTNTWNDLKENFIFEYQEPDHGFNFNLNFAEIGVTFKDNYASKNIKYQNNQKTCSYSAESSFSIGIDEADASIGFGEVGSFASDCENFKPLKDEEISTKLFYNISLPIFKSSNVDVNNDTVFIGVDFGVGFVLFDDTDMKYPIGGNFRIGWEFER